MKSEKDIMDFSKIEEAVTKAVLQKKSLEIYYSQTENNPEGWRKIFPESVTTDIPPQGEKIVVGKEPLSPGYILNAFDDKEKKNLKSFIIGKIRKAQVFGDLKNKKKVL